MAYFQHKNEQNDPVDYLPEDQDLQQDTWEAVSYTHLACGTRQWSVRCDLQRT